MVLLPGDTVEAGGDVAIVDTRISDKELIRTRPKSTASRRFGAAVDVNASASGDQPEVTRTVFATDGRIDYELLGVAGGDVTEDYDYDAQGRVEAIRHFVDADGDRAFDAGEALLSGFTYTHYADGSRKGEVSTDAQGRVTTKAWTYDGLNRLVSEQYDGYEGSSGAAAPNALAYRDTFAFDLVGNRVTLTHDDETGNGPNSMGYDEADAITTYSYDANDRLLTEQRDQYGDGYADRTTTYGYGPGNAGTDQTSKTVAGDTSETTSYAYDVMGRTTQVSIASGPTATSVSYKYDHNGFRVERTENGGATTVYHVDPSNHTGYAQVIEEGVDANGDRKLDAAEVQKAYTLAMDVLSQATATETLRLLTDAHGSVRAALDVEATASAAAVLQQYAYSAYGQDLGLTFTALTALRYAGEAIDPATGLSFNRARWYEPASGRFKRMDPLAAGAVAIADFNRYVHGSGNPIQYVDPSGYFSIGGLLVSLVIGSMVSNLVASIVSPAFEYLASALLPPDITEKILNLAPVATMIGVTGTIGLRGSYGASLGYSVGGGAEALISRSNVASYTFTQHMGISLGKGAARPVSPDVDLVIRSRVVYYITDPS